MIQRPFTLGEDGDEHEEPFLMNILFDQVELVDNLTDEFLQSLKEHLFARLEEAWTTLNRGQYNQVILLVNRISHLLTGIEQLIAEDSLSNEGVPECILTAFTEAWNPPQQLND